MTPQMIRLTLGEIRVFRNTFVMFTLAVSLLLVVAIKNDLSLVSWAAVVLTVVLLTGFFAKRAYKRLREEAMKGDQSSEGGASCA